MIQPAHRIQKTGRYVFEEIARMKREDPRPAEDIFDLGVGSPDQPPDPAIIEMMAAQLAVTRIRRTVVLDDVQQQSRALQVPEEPVPEARPFGGAFDQPRDVGHDEAAVDVGAARRWDRRRAGCGERRGAGGGYRGGHSAGARSSGPAPAPQP